MTMDGLKDTFVEGDVPKKWNQKNISAKMVKKKDFFVLFWTKISRESYRLDREEKTAFFPSLETFAEKSVSNSSSSWR